MANRSDLNLSTLYPYLFEHSVRDNPLLKQLREETAQDAMARMQIAPEQGQFMALLVELMQAENIIEVGTFTGYSSLCMALAMGPQGRMICCDINTRWTDTAQRYWHMAGVSERIELRIAPALETLQALIDSGQQEQFDLMFIDADKENYDRYYEAGLQLIRPGGLILIDNVLWGGRVIDPLANDAETQAIRALNKKLHQDERISLSLLPLADGLTLALKRHK